MPHSKLWCVSYTALPAHQALRDHLRHRAEPPPRYLPFAWQPLCSPSTGCAAACTLLTHAPALLAHTRRILRTFSAERQPSRWFVAAAAGAGMAWLKYAVCYASELGDKVLLVGQDGFSYLHTCAHYAAHTQRGV